MHDSCYFLLLSRIKTDVIINDDLTPAKKNRK